MPEGPEVKITTEFLAEKLENAVITDWSILINYNPNNYEYFLNNLPLLVNSIECKGKLIHFILSNEDRTFHVLHSLRLSGSWEEKEDKYCTCFIEYTVNNETHKLFLRDPRKLATFDFLDSDQEAKDILNKLGPDILTNQFTLSVWKKLVSTHSNKNITAFLMDQNIISGCGNYLKSEALYYAKISPMRKIGSLTNDESEKLYEALRVLSRMSYNDSEFKMSIYKRSFAKSSKTSDGRTTYWDPEVQG